MKTSKKVANKILLVVFIFPSFLSDYSYSAILATIQKTSLYQTSPYEKFRKDQETKIDQNQREIAELKEKRKKMAAQNQKRFQDQIDQLERKNNDLRKRIINSYQEEGKDKWDKFTRDFEAEMKDLQKSLKGLFQDSTNNQ